MKSLLLQAPANGMIGQFILLGGIMVVFYFFMIRPQQKKQKDQNRNRNCTNSKETKKRDADHQDDLADS